MYLKNVKLLLLLICSCSIYFCITPIEFQNSLQNASLFDIASALYSHYKHNAILSLFPADIVKAIGEQNELAAPADIFKQLLGLPLLYTGNLTGDLGNSIRNDAIPSELGIYLIAKNSEINGDISTNNAIYFMRENMQYCVPYNGVYLSATGTLYIFYAQKTSEEPTFEKYTIRAIKMGDDAMFSNSKIRYAAIRQLLNLPFVNNPAKLDMPTANSNFVYYLRDLETANLLLDNLIKRFTMKTDKTYYERIRYIELNRKQILSILTKPYNFSNGSSVDYHVSKQLLQDSNRMALLSKTRFVLFKQNLPAFKKLYTEYSGTENHQFLDSTDKAVLDQFYLLYFTTITQNTKELIMADNVTEPDSIRDQFIKTRLKDKPAFTQLVQWYNKDSNPTLHQQIAAIHRIAAADTTRLGKNEQAFVPEVPKTFLPAWLIRFLNEPISIQITKLILLTVITYSLYTIVTTVYKYIKKNNNITNDHIGIF